MAENKKKKLGLQKNVSSIFKGVPIPQKNGDDNARQTPNAPASGRSRNIPTLERTIGSSPEPQRKDNIPEPEHTINTPEPEHIASTPEPQHKDNITAPEHIASTPEPQHKGDIPVSERTADAPEPEHTIDSSPEPEHTVKTPEPEQTGNIPAKPKFQEPQKSQISLIKKINQPTQLLRKDTPVKQLVVDANKKVTKLSQWQRARDKFFVPKPDTSSTRQKATTVLIPVLAFVFIFVLRQVFWTAPQRTEGAVENDKPGVATTISTSNEIDWKIPALFPSSLRDPMKLNSSGNKQSDAEKSTEIIELNINGILHSEDNPSVLIGDRIAHEGEKISGVTIVKINEDTVEFEMNGKKWEGKVQR